MLFAAAPPDVDPGVILDAVKWLAGSAAAAIAAWFAMKAKQDAAAKELAEFRDWREKQETAAKEARQEAERQQTAWWEEVDDLKAKHAALDKTCSLNNRGLETALQTLKERVDLHSATTVNSLAGVVKNYAEMTEDSMKIIRALRDKG